LLVAAAGASAWSYQEQKGRQKPFPQQQPKPPPTQQPRQEAKQIPAQRRAEPKQMPQPAPQQRRQEPKQVQRQIPPQLPQQRQQIPQQRKQEAKRIPQQLPPSQPQQIPQQRKQEAKRIPQQLPPSQPQQIPQQRKQEAKRIPNQIPQQPRTERLPKQRIPTQGIPTQQPRFPIEGETVRGRRIDRAGQQQLQRQRYNDFDNRWQNWQNVHGERRNDLQRNRRHNYLRYYDRYWNHVQQDYWRLGQARYYDNLYYNYGYWRGGSYYYTSSYGAQLINQAIRNGYEEGYRAGQADRLDGWSHDPYQSYGYVDAAYGYDGYYVGMDEYSYYFREGYLRGYEDGYYRYYHYGHYSGGHFLILDSVLRAIFSYVVH
jgi:hypothetical protein